MNKKNDNPNLKFDLVLIIKIILIAFILCVLVVILSTIIDEMKSGNRIDKIVSLISIIKDFILASVSIYALYINTKSQKNNNDHTEKMKKIEYENQENKDLKEKKEIVLTNYLIHLEELLDDYNTQTLKNYRISYYTIMKIDDNVHNYNIKSIDEIIKDKNSFLNENMENTAKNIRNHIEKFIEHECFEERIKQKEKKKGK